MNVLNLVAMNLSEAQVLLGADNHLHCLLTSENNLETKTV